MIRPVLLPLGWTIQRNGDVLGVDPDLTDPIWVRADEAQLGRPACARANIEVFTNQLVAESVSARLGRGAVVRALFCQHPGFAKR